MLTAKLILTGLRSYLTLKAKKRLAGRSTGSARYCYTVWLRHLVKTFKNDFQACPATVAELGPGHSIGVGLAALISGVEKYFGFDITQYADLKKNLEVFHELVSLFTNREDIPGPKEFPRVNPQLESYEFPHYILTDEWLRKSLNENRIKKIENSILNVNNPHSAIEYAAPWYDSHVLEKDSIDIIMSQAVLEHIDDLSGSYKVMKEWLKPNGLLSHAIDFTCHGKSKEWNGHWTYNDLMWKLIRGNSAYSINREPLSTHIRLLEENGFNILEQTKIKSPSNLTKNKLSSSYKRLSEDDLTTSSVFIQALKSK